MAPKTAELAGLFATLIDTDDERIDLTRAALLIARTEYPNLASEPYLAIMDRLADRVRARLGGTGDDEQVIPALNAVLFAEERFRGNAAD